MKHGDKARRSVGKPVRIIYIYNSFLSNGLILNENAILS